MKELVSYFLKLGLVGFGGPIALIAQMQKDAVQKYQWMDDHQFMKAFGLIKSLPGPTAFMMATYIGYSRKKFWGAFAAGISLVLPAFLMMVFFASQRQWLDEIALFGKIVAGLEVGALTLIIAAFLPLVSPYKDKWLFWFLVIFSFSLSELLSVPEFALIPVFALVSLAITRFSSKRTLPLLSFAGLLEPQVFEVVKSLFIVCLKAGAFVFGTGIVIVSFLENDFVTVHHWLTKAQFSEAIIFGQLTPGPYVITVAYAGFLAAGIFGALAGTIGVFLPAFVHMVTWFPRSINWLANQKWYAEMVIGIIAAVVGVLAATVLHLGNEFHLKQIALLLLYIILMFKFNWSTFRILGLSASFGILFF